jgi:hypothetical protein
MSRAVETTDTAPGIYAVRMIGDHQLVGFFTPPSMAWLHYWVDSVCEPSECEYAVIKHLCLLWPRNAPPIPWPDDYFDKEDSETEFDSHLIEDPMMSDIEEAKWLPLMSQSYVYFAKAGDRVKIGSAKDVGKRMKQLQTGCPDKIQVVKLISGGRDVEASLHRQFARHRAVGEWFKIEGALATYLEDRL